MARSRDLRIQIVGDDRSYRRTLDSSERHTRRFGDTAEKHTKRVTTAFKGMALAAGSAGVAIGTAGLALGVKKAVDEMRDATKVSAQTEAVLKSTGGAANVTTKELERLAERLSMVAGMDDEVIQRTENLLLTFTRIRNETGRGNQIFTQATVAITDMAAAMAAAGGNKAGAPDLKSATIQVGKALQDPIKGITALRRVGVAFTEQQQDQITKLVESGRQMEAQKMILRELRKEFGGSARANADSADRLKVAIDNLFERVGKALAPALEDATRWLVRFINQMERGTGSGGDFVQTLKAIAKGFAAVASIVRDTTRSMVRMGDVVLGVLSSMSRSLAKVIGTANKVPGIGKAIDDDWAPALARSADRIDNLRERLRRLVREPHDVKVNVQVALGPGGREMRPGDGWGIEDAIDSVVQSGVSSGRIDPFGAVGGFIGGGSANLMGAGLHLAPFASLGARMGLRVSSGYFGRENSITSSGNRSYHAMRRAIDLADGPAQMLAYAKLMAASFGGQLRELIHSPLGFSIKDGRRVAPYAVADHYDHVHVAMQRGGMIPGHGSGDKVPVLAEPGEGFINRRAVMALGGERAVEAINRLFPRFQNGGVVAQAARGAGFRGDLLRTMVAIARAESGWNPGAVGDGGNSIGLWQIYRPAHPWAAGLNLKNPSVNARAAMRVYRSQGLGAWSVYNSGAYRAWLDEAAAAIAGGGGPRQGILGGSGPRRGILTGPRRRRGPRPEAINLGEELPGGGTFGGDVGGDTGSAEDPNQALIDAINAAAAQAAEIAAQQLAATEAHTAAITAQTEQAKLNETLIRNQGPALIASLQAILNGGIGGNAGLGRQFPASTGLGGLARA